jgi:hypothetical protein
MAAAPRAEIALGSLIAHHRRKSLTDILTPVSTPTIKSFHYGKRILRDPTYISPNVEAICAIRGRFPQLTYAECRANLVQRDHMA